MGMLERRVGGGRLGLLKFGLFLVLVGIIVGITPNIASEVSSFIGDLQLQQIYSHVFFPLPTNAHPVLYNAVFLFCVGWGIVQLAFFAAHLVVRDGLEAAHTLSSAVFWFGSAYIILYLILQSAPFPIVLGYFIVLVGISVIVRVLGHLVSR